MSEFTEKIRADLFGLQDVVYRDFQAALMPNIDKESVIGVRTPHVRKYAIKLAKNPLSREFLEELPHRYYDENNLHAFLIEQIKDYPECLRQVDRFLPYVDNWATCDMMSPKVFKAHTDVFKGEIYRWIASGKTYTMRFGIGMLMRYYLDAKFSMEDLELVAGLCSEEYYINTMVAWYFATALAKRYDETLPYFKQNRLPAWTHNKAIQKACESNRIIAEHKKILRMLRRKEE